MTGLLLIAVAAMWVAALRWIVRAGFKFVPDRPWRKAAKLGMFALLLPLPLLDELIAAPHVRSLCTKDSSVIVDVPNARGRTVWFSDGGEEHLMFGSIPISQIRLNFVDSTTGELVYHHFRMEAQGGWLNRSLHILENNAPLLFPKVCQPKDFQLIDRNLGTLHVYRPIGR